MKAAIWLSDPDAFVPEAGALFDLEVSLDPDGEFCLARDGHRYTAEELEARLFYVYGAGAFDLAMLEALGAEVLPGRTWPPPDLGAAGNPDGEAGEDQ